MGTEVMGAEGRELDRRIVEALEAAPAVRVADDFALTVCARLPVRRAVSVTATQYGRMAMWVGGGVLLAALLAMAMRGVDRSFYGVAVEWILCGEFAVLAIGLGSQRRVFR